METFDWPIFLCALGLAAIFEGLLWAAFPNGMRETMLYLSTLSPFRLRTGGIASMLTGLFLVWLGRN